MKVFHVNVVGGGDDIPDTTRLYAPNARLEEIDISDAEGFRYCLLAGDWGPVVDDSVDHFCLVEIQLAFFLCC